MLIRNSVIAIREWGNSVGHFRGRKPKIAGVWRAFGGERVWVGDSFVGCTSYAAYSNVSTPQVTQLLSRGDERFAGGRVRQSRCVAAARNNNQEGAWPERAFRSEGNDGAQCARDVA
jgi:hypothetical protein